MYKKQMTLQKIVCMMAIVASALVFVSSLGLSTDLYDALSRTILYPDYDLDATSVQGSRVYYDMFGFNAAFTKASIVLIIINVLLFLTNTHTRRKYYIGNYTATGLSVAASAGMAAWSIPNIAAFKSRFQNEVDFTALKEFSKDWGTLYIGPEDTFWFDLTYGILGFLLFTACLLIVNLVFKIKVMKAEQMALASGRSV
ncbi:hypothetical protein [Ruminococcus albus]|uniref:Uncharacterized protein n=1 Tax=Ruminococcus albus (strain ATCC 27210 / DSM 20455 / JCM 14654 / NCDO 2250 / 7) TaxID=697329 RepID=E6UC56_RUMA7|nr:hypothetical protein [Ruminococcus albus]ADU22678.1 hypothetical protein Rumal_2192 [Ruminococcus albus 7 = DSM 20455]